MVTRIQLRRGTFAEWMSVNPVLLAGEPGYELDTGHYRIGDGSSAWSELPVFQAGTVSDPEGVPTQFFATRPRTNVVPDPDFDVGRSWATEFKAGNPAMEQATQAFSDATTRRGCKVTFTSATHVAGGSLRIGRSELPDITVPSTPTPVSAQVILVSSTATAAWCVINELRTDSTVVRTTWGPVTGVPAGGDGARLQARLPATDPDTARLQLLISIGRGQPLMTGDWFLVTGATVELTDEPRGDVFSGNDANAHWTGVPGESPSVTAVSRAPREEARLFGRATVNGMEIAVLSNGGPSWLLDEAWSPPRTTFTAPRLAWARGAPHEGWPNGTLCHDGEYVFQAFHSARQLGNAPRGMTVSVRRQRLGSASPESEVHLWDTTAEGRDADVNAALVMPNGDWGVILRVGRDTFPIPAPTLEANFLLRSTDQGLTWDRGTKLLAASGSPLNVTSISAPYVTRDGTTLSTAIVNTSDRKFVVLRNSAADLNAAWEVVSLPGIASDQVLLEGNFVQFVGGLIGCVIRPASKTDRALIACSTDDGLTWSSPKISNLVLNNNPATVIYHPQADSAEVFVGNRPAVQIRSSLATADNFVAASFPPATVVVDGRADPSSIGFGYPAALRLPDGRVLLRYMDWDSPSTNTAIWEAWGRTI